MGVSSSLQDPRDLHLRTGLVDLRHVGEKDSTQIRTANSPSMRILINRICIAFRGLLNPKNVLRVISVRAATAVLSWNERKFWMLWKIDLPRTLSANTSHQQNIAHTLFYGRQYCRKIVVNKDHVGSLFRYVSSTLAHGNADVCHFESRRIVYYRTA